MFLADEEDGERVDGLASSWKKDEKARQKVEASARRPQGRYLTFLSL